MTNIYSTSKKSMRLFGFYVEKKISDFAGITLFKFYAPVQGEVREYGISENTYKEVLAKIKEGFNYGHKDLELAEVSSALWEIVQTNWASEKEARQNKE